MKTIIADYLPLKDEDKSKLWENAIFVFDANVLLNLYRYSRETTKTLLDALGTLSPRIWIPYQVAFEFMRRRCNVIYDTIEKYTEFEKKISSFVDDAKGLANLSNSCSEITQLTSVLNKWLESCKKNNLLVSNANNDFILTRLLDLFNNRTGSKYTSEQEALLVVEGERRIKAQIPPGYKDANKKISDSCDNNAYGDFFVWSQIIDFALVKGMDIIFITNDRKEDWWYEIKGRLIGPRTELLCEFRSKTKQQFHMYTMDAFLTMFSRKNKSSIDTKVINEVKNSTYLIEDKYTNQLSEVLLQKISDEKELKKAIDLIGRNREFTKFFLANAVRSTDEESNQKISHDNYLETIRAVIRNADLMNTLESRKLENLKSNSSKLTDIEVE